VTDDIVTRLRDSDGQGCTCQAYSYYECGCTEAVWAEMFIDEAANEIERLRELVRFKSSQIDRIRDAVENKGPEPKYHDRVHRKHMKEWPTLWKAIYSSWEELAQRPYYVSKNRQNK
jgi:hypothetical protein